MTNGCCCYCPTCFAERAWDHFLRVPRQDLPLEAGVRLLEWAWAGAIQRRGEEPVPITANQRKHLGVFLLALREHRAFMALCHVVRNWSDFREYAAYEYGAFYGNPEKGPARPRLDQITVNRDAAVNFWREHDRAESLIREQAPFSSIRKALVDEYGLGAETRIDQWFQDTAAPADCAPPGEPVH